MKITDYGKWMTVSKTNGRAYYEGHVLFEKDYEKMFDKELLEVW